MNTVELVNSYYIDSACLACLCPPIEKTSGFNAADERQDGRTKLDRTPPAAGERENARARTRRFGKTRSSPRVVQVRPAARFYPSARNL